MEFTRIAIDVDDQGHAVGASYERRSEDAVTVIHVCSPPGPFDTPSEAFEATLEVVLDRFGVQMRLFE